MTKSKNSPEYSHIKIMPTMKLEEFEQKLASNADNNNNFKTGLNDSVTNLQEEVLPLRLKFNEFMNLMATLDQEDANNGNNNKKMTQQERFAMVKTNLVSLYDDIQKLSNDFQSLEELFGCIAEYSSVNQSKEFEPLESLSINYTSNINTSNTTPTHTTGTPSSTTTAAHGKKNETNSHTNSKGSPPGSTPSSATMIAATPGSTTNNNAHATGNTPAATPTTTAKKPRKPRQPRKQSAASQSSTPASGNISINTNMNPTSKMQSPAMIQTPLMTSNGNTPLTTMNMGQGTMNPSTILGMTPNGHMNNPNGGNNNNSNNAMNGAAGAGIPSGNSSTILSPANVLNNAILNTQGNGNNNNNNNNNNGMTINTPSGNLGGTGAPNSLTPANILSMSNVNMNNILPGSNNMMNNGNTTTNLSGNNNNNDMANMDLTSLDLSSLNMNFL